jgi:hypothetical protein
MSRRTYRSPRREQDAADTRNDMPVAMWHVVVPSRKAEDRAHLGGSGEEARLLAEGEGAVDFVLAACVVKGSDQVLAEDDGLE